MRKIVAWNHCPVHDISMAQSETIFDDEGSPRGYIMDCPKKDCHEIKVVDIPEDDVLAVVLPFRPRAS